MVCRHVGFSQLESRYQCRHVAEKIRSDCDIFRQDHRIPGNLRPFSLLRRLVLTQRFSDSRRVKSTTSLVKTPCLVCLASIPLHPSFPNRPIVPYVVGMNPNSPRNPHSALASGGDDISNINTSPPVEAYVLYGGVVGGPDKRDKYYDIRDDWPETEVKHLWLLLPPCYPLRPFRRSRWTTTHLSLPSPPCTS